MSSAVALLAQGGSLRGAEYCPHKRRLEACAIRVDADRPMVICPSCKEMFESLIAGWHARQLSAGQVVSTMLQHGYSRGDAARLVLQLVADRLKVRLGFLKQEDL